MFAHCWNPPPDPRQTDPSIPAACAAVVKRAMAKDPRDRYRSAGEMIADLEAALGRFAAASPVRRRRFRRPPRPELRPASRRLLPRSSAGQWPSRARRALLQAGALAASVPRLDLARRPLPPHRRGGAFAHVAATRRPRWQTPASSPGAGRRGRSGVWSSDSPPPPITDARRRRGRPGAVPPRSRQPAAAVPTPCRSVAAGRPTPAAASPRVAFSPDGASLAATVADGDGGLRAWDVADGRRSARLAAASPPAAPPSSRDPQGRALTSGRGKRGRVVLRPGGPAQLPVPAGGDVRPSPPPRRPTFSPSR